jgi:hypothetical protein
MPASIASSSALVATMSLPQFACGTPSRRNRRERCARRRRTSP